MNKKDLQDALSSAYKSRIDSMFTVAHNNIAGKTMNCNNAVSHFMKGLEDLNMLYKEILKRINEKND